MRFARAVRVVRRWLYAGVAVESAAIVLALLDLPDWVRMANSILLLATANAGIAGAVVLAVLRKAHEADRREW